MEFDDVVKNRYSVRGFKDKAVEDEKIKAILEVARFSPTAVNFQPFKLFVIDTIKNKDALLKIYNKDWFVEAPIVIGIAVNKSKAWTRPWDGKFYGDVDASIVMTEIILKATDLGLGTCFIGAFNSENASEFLDLDDEWEAVLFTPLGYADAEPRENTHKSLDELVVFK